MTLVTQVNNLATRVGTEFKTAYSKQGNLTSLATTNKTSLVAAINEIFSAAGAGVTINDAATSTTTVYSSSKTAALVSAKPSINDTTASGTSVYSSSKTDGQINAALGTRPAINDTTPSASSVYSSSKTDTQISAAVTALVNNSPAALDTLKELSDALGGDQNYAATTAAALGYRLRFDAAQTLSAPQKLQGQTNLGAQAAVDIGDPATDFVATFNTALV